MPERFEIHIVYKWRYINTLFPFLSFANNGHEKTTYIYLAILQNIGPGFIPMELYGIPWKFHGVLHMESHGGSVENFTCFSPRNSMGYKTGTANLHDRHSFNLSLNNSCKITCMCIGLM